MAKYQYSLAILAAAFLWSTSYAISKLTLDYFSPATLALLRFILSIGMLAAILALRQKSFALPKESLLKQLALSGMLGYTLYFILQNWGIKLALATDASLLVASYPVITAILERLVFKRPIPAKNWAGIILALSGVVLIIQPWGIGTTITPERFAGIGLLVLTGVSWAVYNLIINKLDNIDTFQLTFWQTCWGALFILPFALGEAPRFAEIPATAWLGLFYLALFCSLIAFLLYNFGLRGVQPNEAVNILNSVPVFGVIIAYFALGETLNLIQVLGGIVVIAGVSISLKQKEPRHFHKSASSYSDSQFPLD